MDDRTFAIRLLRGGAVFAAFVYFAEPDQIRDWVMTAVPALGAFLGAGEKNS